MDTIFALSTAPGKAGVAIIRVSGPAAHEAVNLLCGDVPPPRKASLRILRDRTGHRLDEALVLTFTEDHSFTGRARQSFKYTEVKRLRTHCLWNLNSSMAYGQRRRASLRAVPLRMECSTWPRWKALLT